MATPEQRGATAKLSNTARQQVSAVPDRARCGDKEIPIKGGHVARKAVGETSAGKLLSGVHFLSKNAPVIFPPYHL